MSQEFVRHPTIKNYEASRDGVVRNCRLKKPVGVVNNVGYLRFTVGKKKYLNHRFIYERFFIEIPKGLVIDHIDRNKCNNNINNFQAVIPSENNIRENVGKCKIFGKRAVKSVNTQTCNVIIVHSMKAAGKYFGIHSASIQRVADKVIISALSKIFNQRIIFSYSVPDTKDTLSG